MLVCAGTATFGFEDSGKPVAEHAFISFDLPDPVTPAPEGEEFGPHLVFNNPLFRGVHFPGTSLSVIDRFTVTASPASFNEQGSALWAVDWADADWNS
jgi:hypothetical protein